MKGNGQAWAALEYLKKKGRIRWNEIPADLRRGFQHLLKWINEGGRSVYMSDLYWDARDLREGKKRYTIAYSPDLGEFTIVR